MTTKFETHITRRGVTSIKPPEATHIDEAIDFAIGISRQVEQRVILTFNGRRLFVEPNSDKEAIFQRYRESLANHPKRTRKSAFK